MAATHDVTVPDINEVVGIVVEVVKQHGGLYQNSPGYQVKGDGSWVTAIDHQLQKGIFAALNERWPNFQLLGEEMSHAEQQRSCDRSAEGLWVLDPLDGTTNFISGFLFFGVSLALVIDGITHLAVVYDPNREEIFSAALGQGAYLNGVPLNCRSDLALGDCIANVDYKRLFSDLSVRLVRSPPYRSQRNLGSSVLEWCWLSANRVQVYLHGGQKLWDYAAGYLILNEAGGASISLSGKPINCSRMAKSSVVAATSPELLTEWYRWIDDNCKEVTGTPL